MEFLNLSSAEFNALDPEKILVATTDGEDLSVVTVKDMQEDFKGKSHLEILDEVLRHVSGNKQEVIIIDEDGIPFKGLVD